MTFATARASNDRTADRASVYNFASRFPMFCECGDPVCSKTLLISLDGYREARQERGVVTAPEHRIPGADTVLRDGQYWVQRLRTRL